ncbi:sugar ABC transporter ATP-binding protein [Clostridia bacterium]|nr:sugar ABC transporter ATP-binding protein [Clostridia bacterium]
MGSISDEFIVLEDISKRFGKLEALKNVSLKIERNKITSLVGDNGSGKSTLIKILSGNLKPNGGTIYINGKAYNYLLPKIAKQCGISTVYQDLSLDNYKDVVENIFLGQEITRFGFIIDYPKMQKQTEKLLEKLEIDIPYLGTSVGYLSGGQRQSIAIARSIFQGEKLIIFDEPTAAMGIKESAATNKMIQSLPAKGFTVLMISHDLNQVFDTADRIYVMRNGEIIKDAVKNDITLTELKTGIKETY